jgi:hypothetical protein
VTRASFVEPSAQHRGRGLETDLRQRSAPLRHDGHGNGQHELIDIVRAQDNAGLSRLVGPESHFFGGTKENTLRDFGIIDDENET